MDEADCCSFPRSVDEGGSSCILPDDSGDRRYEKATKEEENILKRTPHNDDYLSSYSFSEENQIRPPENVVPSDNASLVHRSAHDSLWASKRALPSQQGDRKYCPSIGSESLQHQLDREQRQSEKLFDKSQDSIIRADQRHPHDAGSETRHHHGDNHQDNMPSNYGTDDTDQGQVVPTYNLTDNHSEYSTVLPNSQYYSKPRDTAGVVSRSDTTVKESPGLSHGYLQTAVRDTHMNIGNEASPCAIHQGGTSTVQGQSQSNSKPSLASSTPVGSEEEMMKRKMSSDERRGEDHGMMTTKKQKVSPTIQPEVQYNQNILSMPTQYQVSGQGNYIFDSPKNCTFNLYKSGPASLPLKQHALQWAGHSSQTDSVNGAGTMPTEALETVAKLIAQATNWKTIARLLPMSECPTLETDIKALDDCEGTTSDKTMAVLMRWWKEHPCHGDMTRMKGCLKDGLECCGLVRLARTLDKYF